MGKAEKRAEKFRGVAETFPVTVMTLSLFFYFLKINIPEFTKVIIPPVSAGIGVAISCVNKEEIYPSAAGIRHFWVSLMLFDTILPPFLPENRSYLSQFYRYPVGMQLPNYHHQILLIAFFAGNCQLDFL